MKKYIMMMLVLTISTISQAQRPGKERIEAMKIGFITKKLNLTGEEAQRFWPVYNRFVDEQEKLRKNTRANLIEDLSDPSSLSDAEAEKALQEMLQFKSNEAELIRKYTNEFKKVIPVQKVVMLFKAEIEFKRELLKQLKERGR
ncbi:MAG: hypothetical protein ACOVP1_03330 [Bacteroidia bacterium]